MGTSGGVDIHLPSTYIHLPRGVIHLPGDYIHLPGGDIHLPGVYIHLPGDGIDLPGVGIHLPGPELISHMLEFILGTEGSSSRCWCSCSRC